MAKFVAPQTVIAGLRVLRDQKFSRVGRVSALGFLLLKTKEASIGEWFNVRSIGQESVGPEVEKYLRLAPGTALPDLNPFGSFDGSIEFLAPDYERRGTYTQLLDGRNLARFLEVKKAAGALSVRIPETAAADVLERLGKKIPLKETASFFMRGEPFPDHASEEDVIAHFAQSFNLTTREITILFTHSTEFEIHFSDAPFNNDLSTLPPDLQPKITSTSHAAAAQAGRTLVQLAEFKSNNVVIDDRQLRRIQRAFTTSKAISLVGPPGTAKSSIWAELLKQAESNPQLLGLRNPPSYLTVTAEMDWTSRTIIGGYYPQEDGKLVFREGFLLQAIKNNQILWIEELNRADLDRVLGPVLTFLAKQPVDLGVTHLGSELSGDPAKKMVLVWSEGTESGCKEDAEQRVYYAGADWRLIGTYNNTDRGRVFPMGSALQRRWALVPIPPIAPETARGVIADTGVRGPVTELLASAYALHLKHIPIGLAPFLDIARYVGSDESGSDFTYIFGGARASGRRLRVIHGASTCATRPRKSEGVL